MAAIELQSTIDNPRGIKQQNVLGAALNSKENKIESLR